MGPLGELMEKFPLFGDLPEGFQFDDQALTKIVAMVHSMTRAERQRPDVITDGRLKRIAKGSGRTEKEVKDLLKQYNSMRAVMKQVGSAPGLLSRLPGVKQLMQLRKLQGKGMEDVLGEDAAAVEAAMQGGLVPDAAPRDGPPEGLHAADAVRRDGPRPADGLRARADPHRDPRRARRPQEKRKQERQARKKNRKRGRK